MPAVSSPPAFIEPASPSAGHLAEVLAGTPGITAILLANPMGEPAAGAVVGDGTKEAALATFVNNRALEVAVDEGDFRGIGRQISNSRLAYVYFSGREGDHAVIPFNGGSVFASFARGPVAAQALAQIRETLQRFE